MTREQADILIAYMEIMEDTSDHQTNMKELVARGFSEEELNEACLAIAKIAGRDFSIY